MLINYSALFLIAAFALAFAAEDDSSTTAPTTEEPVVDECNGTCTLDHQVCVNGSCQCDEGYLGNEYVHCHEEIPDDDTETVYDPLIKILMNNFGADAYRSIVNKRGYGSNLVISPFSMHLGAAALLSGATDGSETQTELIKLFSKFGDIEAIRKSYGRITQEYKDLASVISIANSLWSPSSMKTSITPDFIASASKTFGTEYMFIDESELDPAKVINTWVSERTKGQINEIFDSVVPDYQMVLAEAIRFSDSWFTEFDDVEDDKDKKFTLWNNETKLVPTMMRNSPFLVPMGVQVQKDMSIILLSIPYLGHNHRFEFIVMMPKKASDWPRLVEFIGNTGSCRQASDRLLKNIGQDRMVSLIRYNVFMPKFNITSTVDMREVYEAGGATTMFTNGEFGKASSEQINLSQVQHKCNIAVDLTGTERSDAKREKITSPSDIVEAGMDFHINRPFMFMIVDWKRYFILHLGHVADPTME